MRKLLIGSLLFLAACSGDSDSADQPNDIETMSDAGVVDNGDSGTSDQGQEEPSFASVCEYTNPFSQGPECRSYQGDWDETTAQADCDEQMGTLAEGSCAEQELLGRCVAEADPGQVTVFLYGTEGCNFAVLGCEQFIGGTFEPEPICNDEEPSTPGNVFIPPEKICTDPLPGEPAGDGPNGQVCTWQLISGATEEGRKFEDYASCDVVRTQRPYGPYPRPDDAERDDPRLEDPAYKAEHDWVKSQIQASACVCCHANSITPDGASNWDIEQPGNFMNGFYDSGLALGANWVNSEALGAFDAEENNGFGRAISGFPSTDPERMRDFFIAELDFRGLSESDFTDAPPFGGPLYDQIYFEPEACADGVGVDGMGGITWSGPGARYIYILESDSLSPTVPPNLDTPEGTLWRLDVAPEDEPMESGSVQIGIVPENATQVVPDTAAPMLEDGQTYYLFVAADVGIPVLRCLFER